jgi:hypothetical protein
MALRVRIPPRLWTCKSCEPHVVNVSAAGRTVSHVYTCSDTLRSWCCLTQREHLYGHWVYLNDIQMQLGPRVKYPIYLNDLNQIWIFPYRYSKTPPISNFTDVRPVGSLAPSCDQTEGQTDII